MTKEVQMSIKMERELRDEFMAIATERHRPAAQIIRDLMRLYQEAAFNDPVLNSARFNYAANKEIYWQGLSTLLPQVSANPTATRFFQHGEGNKPHL